MTRPVSSSPGFTTVFGRELVGELPSNATGKVMKDVLRERVSSS